MIGKRVQFKLQRPYTKEEIKKGYDNNIEGHTGTIINFVDGCAGVRIDEPLIYRKTKYWYYTDEIENMILL